MSERRSLLGLVRGLLERTYAMRTGLDGVAPFVIGDRGLMELYEYGGDAKMLVRETEGGATVSLYLPDDLVERLEQAPPQHGLHDGNVDDFATFVEELDHLLVLAERVRQGRRVSLFELELHANISKHLVLSRFLAGAKPVLGEHERTWLHTRLFDRGRFEDERYRDAERWAVRMLRALPASIETRLRTLRRFHDVDGAGKVELIRSLAAA